MSKYGCGFAQLMQKVSNHGKPRREPNTRRPVAPAAHNLLPFNLVLHSSFLFKIVLRVVAIADSAISDFKARQVDRGRRTQIVSAPSLPHTHLPPDRTRLLHSVIIKAVSANCLHCDSTIKPASFLPHPLPNPLHRIIWRNILAQGEEARVSPSHGQQ